MVVFFIVEFHEESILVSSNKNDVVDSNMHDLVADEDTEVESIGPNIGMTVYNSLLKMVLRNNL